MRIELSNVSKRFHQQWIFRDISYTIPENEILALTGPNGSGKSTLLKIISSFIDPTSGSVRYFNGPAEISYDRINGQIAMCSPDMVLVEELTLNELLNFHFTFREPTCDTSEMVRLSGLQSAQNKCVAEFSSGMKQRLKLLLSFYSKSEILLLDEPTANMDEEGVEWYLNEMQHKYDQRTIIIASNQRYEYGFTKNILNIADYKSKSNTIE